MLLLPTAMPTVEHASDVQLSAPRDSRFTFFTDTSHPCLLIFSRAALSLVSGQPLDSRL